MTNKNSFNRISVAVRVRPQCRSDHTDHNDTTWLRTPTNNQIILTRSTVNTPVSHSTPSNWQDRDSSSQSSTSRYQFDAVFDTNTNNAQIYDSFARPVVTSTLLDNNVDAHNFPRHALILAYGQTSSGKTHTMQGTDLDPGIIPRAIVDFFSTCQCYQDERLFDAPRKQQHNDHFSTGPLKVSVSYVEVYNDRVKDLLGASAGSDVSLRDIGPYVFTTATRLHVQDVNEALQIFKQGVAMRSTGDTPINVQSSRSHTVFTLHFHRTEVQSTMPREQLKSQGMVHESTLQLVDLAGSERIRHTNATGVRLREGRLINQSLLVLGTIISRLSNPSSSTDFQNFRHLPFRDSKLTRLLRPALQPQGKARVAILATVSPSSTFASETLSTLQFASRAKTISLRSSTNISSGILQNQVDDIDSKGYRSRYKQLCREFDVFRQTFTRLQTELDHLRRNAAVPNNSFQQRDIDNRQQKTMQGSNENVTSECTESSIQSITSFSPVRTNVSPRKPPKCGQQMSCSSELRSSPIAMSLSSPSSSALSLSGEQDTAMSGTKAHADNRCMVRNWECGALERENELCAHVQALTLENEQLRNRLRMAVGDMCRQRLQKAMLLSLARSQSLYIWKCGHDRIESAKESKMKVSRVSLDRASKATVEITGSCHDREDRKVLGCGLESKLCVGGQEAKRTVAKVESEVKRDGGIQGCNTSEREGPSEDVEMKGGYLGVLRFSTFFQSVFNVLTQSGGEK